MLVPLDRGSERVAQFKQGKEVVSGAITKNQRRAWLGERVDFGKYRVVGSFCAGIGKEVNAGRLVQVVDGVVREYKIKMLTRAVEGLESQWLDLDVGAC